MSLPISTVGGSYFGINIDVAAKTKDRGREALRRKSVVDSQSRRGRVLAAERRERRRLHAAMDARAGGAERERRGFRLLLFRLVLRISQLRSASPARATWRRSRRFSTSATRLTRALRKAVGAGPPEQGDVPQLLWAESLDRVQLWLARRVEYPAPDQRQATRRHAVRRGQSDRELLRRTRPDAAVRRRAGAYRPAMWDAAISEAAVTRTAA